MYMHRCQISIDHEGEVDMIPEGLRNVSGLAGLTGAGLFVGDVARSGLVGDFDPDEEGLTVD